MGAGSKGKRRRQGRAALAPGPAGRRQQEDDRPRSTELRALQRDLHDALAKSRSAAPPAPRPRTTAASPPCSMSESVRCVSEKLAMLAGVMENLEQAAACGQLGSALRGGGGEKYLEC